MLQFRQNSYAEIIFKYISFSGELPWSSIDLIPGEHRIVVRYIKKLKDEGYVTVNGQGEDKVIRLTIKGTQKMQLLYPDVYKDYMFNSEGHKFRGGKTGISTKIRHFRLNEVCSILYLANVVFSSSNKPALFLDNKEYEKISDFSTPLFYYSREIKNLDEKQKHKVEFTRILGLLITEEKPYNVYNTNKSLIKWNNQGENKIQLLTEAIINNNFNYPKEKAISDSCIIFGKEMSPALSILNNNKKMLPDENGFELLSFKNSYNHMHYVPIDANGVFMIKILSTLNYNKIIASNLFSKPDERDVNHVVDCNYYSEGINYLFFFDGDLGRLRRFYLSATLYDTSKFKILCFPFQYNLIESFTDKNIPIEIISLKKIISFFKKI